MGRKHDNLFRRRDNFNSDIRKRPPVQAAANKTKKKRMHKNNETIRVPKRKLIPLSVKKMNYHEKKRKLGEIDEGKPLKKKRRKMQTIEIFTDSSDSSDDVPIIAKRVKPLQKKKQKINEAKSKKRGPKEVQASDDEMDEMKKICNRLN